MCVFGHVEPNHNFGRNLRTPAFMMRWKTTHMCNLKQRWWLLVQLYYKNSETIWETWLPAYSNTPTQKYVIIRIGLENHCSIIEYLDSNTHALPNSKWELHACLLLKLYITILGRVHKVCVQVVIYWYRKVTKLCRGIHWTDMGFQSFEQATPAQRQTLPLA